MFLRRTKIGRSYRNMLRYKQIVTILIKHGFRDFVEHSNLLKKINFKDKIFGTDKYQPKTKKIINSHWQRLRMVLEELGPTYIKLGQFLSNRPDIVPSELCNELEKLLDDVPPFSGNMAVMILEKELNASINDVFKHFTKKPFSAASISQVHEGILKNGKKVAVKIQRPGIKSIIDADIDIMYHMAKLIKKHVEGAEVIDPIDIVDEFKDGIIHELDFENEAINIDKFYIQFKDNDSIKVPAVYKEYSTKNVLCMEYMEGTKFTELDTTDKNLDVDTITSQLADLVLMQIFEKGYFHADPHSANLLVCEDNKICFIDFGLMGLLPPKHKTSMCEMIFGLVHHNPERITRAIIRVSLNKEIENKNILENQVFKIIENYAYLPLEDINVGHFLRDLLNTIVANKLKIPADMYLLLKAMVSLEGTVRKIKPKFDMISHFEPYVKKLIYATSGPAAFLKAIYKSGFDYTTLLCELPAELRELFDQIKNKTMKIQFEHRGLEPLLDKGDQIINRVAFSIITASMMIGSALIIHARMPPLVAGVSLIGVITFLFSVFMGALLLIYIIKHGKM
jgi:ubiquinone biosynthesis protein